MLDHSAAVAMCRSEHSNINTTLRFEQSHFGFIAHCAIGQYLDLKNLYSTFNLNVHKVTKLWNVLPSDLKANYLKSLAIFVNRLKQLLQSNQ